MSKKTRVPLTVLVVAVGGILLAGCSGTSIGAASSGAAAPGPASPTESGPLGPVTGPTASPTASPTEASAADFPSDCRSLVSAATYTTLSKTPLNDPAVVGSPVVLPKTELSAAMPAGGKTLYCVWREPQADVSYLSIEVAALDPATGPGVLTKAGLAAKGFTCGSLGLGTRCQKVSKDNEYGVPVGDTYYVQGAVGVHIGQANFPTNGLLNEVVAHVF